MSKKHTLVSNWGQMPPKMAPNEVKNDSKIDPESDFQKVEKSFKNIIQVVKNRPRNSGNSCISERMLKNVIQVVDFEHRKFTF